MTAHPDALRFDAVTFRYPDTDVPAIADVTLAIDEGTFALVAGPTGAGKSTLLRCANGLVPHFTGGTFRGRVFAAGRDTLAHPPRRLADVVAFVPQDPAASFVVDRVEDELAYGMENLGTPPAHMRRRIEEMLDLLDIEPLRDRSVRSLSGGERQRVAIAAAMAAGPRILVLDEPTSQLDPQAAEHVIAALQRLVHDQGLTVLLAEHRLERVAGVVDVGDRGGRRPGRAGLARRRDRRSRLGATGGPSRPAAGVGPGPADRARSAAAPRPRRAASSRPHRRPPATRWSRSAAFRPRTATSRRSAASTCGCGRARSSRSWAATARGRRRCCARSPACTRRASGDVRVDGRSSRPGTDVALCPQEPEAILFADTVADEVRVTLRARGLPPASAEPLLDELGIASLAGAHPRDLSAGQRLLVAVAATAAGSAPVLLLDEPTRGLDLRPRNGSRGSYGGTPPGAAPSCSRRTTSSLRQRSRRASSCLPVATSSPTAAPRRCSATRRCSRRR